MCLRDIFGYDLLTESCLWFFGGSIILRSNSKED